MRQVIAIGNNYLRQMWYIAVLYLAYAALLTWLDRESSMLGLNTTMATEGLFLLGIAVVVSVAGVPNDQRSRRILTVLSKGVTRGEYLAGMLYATLVMVAGMTVMSAGSWWWIAWRNELGVPAGLFVKAAVVVIVLALLLMCAGLLGVSWLHSKFAIVAPVLVWVLPMMPTWFGGPAIPLPHQGMLEQVASPFAEVVGAGAMAGTVGEAAVLFAAAVVLFGRKDVTRAGE